jgi:dihydrofolate reductase
MRRLRYGVAMSLDGFIAGPNGEHDWIVPDPAIDFASIWAQFDAVLMGRRSYEIARERRASFAGSSQRWIVASTTMQPESNPDVEILTDSVDETVAKLKAMPGKDIWLMGGGVLFRSLLDAGLVDGVDVMVMPALLGSGVPMLPKGRRCSLHLIECKALPSGIVMLNYSVVQESAAV